MSIDFLFDVDIAQTLHCRVLKGSKHQPYSAEPNNLVFQKNYLGNFFVTTKFKIYIDMMKKLEYDFTKKQP